MIAVSFYDSHICYFTLLSGVFENAINYYITSASELKEERAMLLEEWLNLGSGFGEQGEKELLHAEDLYKKFVSFEKQYGDRESTEDANVGKWRLRL